MDRRASENGGAPARARPRSAPANGSAPPARARPSRSRPSCRCRCGPGSAGSPTGHPPGLPSWRPPRRGSRESALAPAPRRIAFETADHLARLEGRHPAPILDAERLLERQAPLLVRTEPVAAQRRLRSRRDLPRERHRGRERLTAWDESVGEAHPQRLLAGNAATGEDQVQRVAVPDEARAADRAAVHQRNAPAPTEDAEHGVLGRDAKVAPGGELETARDGVSLDRRDDGLAEE